MCPSQAGLEAAGRGACGGSQGGPGCVSLPVSLSLPAPGAQCMGWPHVQSVSPGWGWGPPGVSSAGLEVKPGPWGGQAGADLRAGVSESM